MASERLPIAGYPHLALAAQEDQVLRARILTALRNKGFTIEPARVIPPEGATGATIISAITAAFQAAKTG